MALLEETLKGGIVALYLTTVVTFQAFRRLTMICTVNNRSSLTGHGLSSTRAFSSYCSCALEWWDVHSGGSRICKRGGGGHKIMYACCLYDHTFVYLPKPQDRRWSKIVLLQKDLFFFFGLLFFPFSRQTCLSYIFLATNFSIWGGGGWGHT